MVRDYHVQMFPIREEYVATPITKIYALAEFFIYRRSLRQSARPE